MGKFTLVALVVCLAVASAKPLYKDTKTILAQVEEHHVGHSMLSLIQANMAVGNPVEFIIESLQMYRDNTESEQDEADKLNATEQADCDVEIAKLHSTIAEIQSSISNLTTLISENEAILAAAKATLAQAQQDWEGVVRAIDQGTAQREAEHKEWATKDYELSVDITTVEEGIRLVQHMLHGVAFVEIEGRYNKVLAQMQARSTSIFKPMVVQLTQLASKFNYENVQKVLELLDNIRKGFVDEQTNARAAEETAQADWEKRLAQLTSHKMNLERKISVNKNTIETTTELLKNYRISLAKNQNALEENNELLKSEIESCEEASAKYLAETKERERVIELLDQLIEHIRNKTAAIEDYLTDRAAGAPVF